MKFDLRFERTYPHPVARVWRALTEREPLGEWLMETDFVAEPGREFSMWCDDGGGGTDRYRCRLLELEPQRRMLWSWTLDGRPDEAEMLVELVLEAVPDGTRLTIRHRGDRDPQAAEDYEGGWPHKLAQLEGAIEAAG